MKRVLVSAAVAIMVMSLAAFTVVEYQVKNSTAEVEQVSGVYVFVNSKPVHEYEYMGTVKSAGVVMSKDYEDLMPKMVKRAIKEYPKADAVIFKNGEIYEADVIKFK